MSKKLSRIYLFWVNIFPPTPLAKALSIAKKECEDCAVYVGDETPIYRTDQMESNHPFWYLYISKNEKKYSIGAGRVIVISKITGKVIYDGAAGE